MTSDLREKLSDMGFDADEQVRVFVLFERSAVERERAAFVAGGQYAMEDLCVDKDVRHALGLNAVDESARRYPLPKEE